MPSDGWSTSLLQSPSPSPPSSPTTSSRFIELPTQDLTTELDLSLRDDRAQPHRTTFTLSKLRGKKKAKKAAADRPRHGALRCADAEPSTAPQSLAGTQAPSQHRSVTAATSRGGWKSHGGWQDGQGRPVDTSLATRPGATTIITTLEARKIETKPFEKKKKEVKKKTTKAASATAKGKGKKKAAAEDKIHFSVPPPDAKPNKDFPILESLEKQKSRPPRPSLFAPGNKYRRSLSPDSSRSPSAGPSSKPAIGIDKLLGGFKPGPREPSERNAPPAPSKSAKDRLKQFKYGPEEKLEANSPHVPELRSLPPLPRVMTEERLEASKLNMTEYKPPPDFERVIEISDDSDVESPSREPAGTPPPPLTSDTMDVSLNQEIVTPPFRHSDDSLGHSVVDAAQYGSPRLQHPNHDDMGSGSQRKVISRSQALSDVSAKSRPVQTPLRRPLPQNITELYDAIPRHLPKPESDIDIGKGGARQLPGSDPAWPSGDDDVAEWSTLPKPSKRARTSRYLEPRPSRFNIPPPLFDPPPRAPREAYTSSPPFPGLESGLGATTPSRAAPAAKKWAPSPMIATSQPTRATGHSTQAGYVPPGVKALQHAASPPSQGPSLYERWSHSLQQQATASPSRAAGQPAPTAHPATSSSVKKAPEEEEDDWAKAWIQPRKRSAKPHVAY